MRTFAANEARRKRLHRIRHPAWLGTMRRTTPLSQHWGFDRGTPVDRHYVDRFLGRHRADVRGRVLEVMDGRYTARYGIDVEQADVLDIDPSNKRATLVGDLSVPGTLQAGSFDCIILTQTLQFIYDVQSAITEAHGALGEGGTLLVTAPAVSRVDRSAGIDGDFWRFTTASFKRMFHQVFGEENVSVESFGNVLTAVAFLMGMAAEELKAGELDTGDEFFPVLIGARAVKA